MNRIKKTTILIITLAMTVVLMGCALQTDEVSPGQNADSRRLSSESDTDQTEPSMAADASDEEASFDDEEDDLDEFEEEFEEAKPDVYDPFEGYNRAMTTFNDRLYLWVLDPLGRGYAYVIPAAPRRGIRNFFHNLLFPLRFVNNVLQFKLKNAGEETLRFVTNTTIGIFGFWDPAREWFGLEKHDEDFGQTLGFYGVGAGPHIVLPFFGPSNLRDTFSMYPDNYLTPRGQHKPIGQTDNYVMEYGIYAFEAVNEASLRPGEYQSLKKDAVDFYAFMRDGYEQIRQKEIKE